MKLPILKSVTVEHLSLYTRTVKIKVLPGLNLIIGGNGIGKTTLVNTILFGLVGNASYQQPGSTTTRAPLIEEDYFQGRLEPRDYDPAQVKLTIGIGKDEIRITRALERPSIRKLAVRRAGSRTSDVIVGEPRRLEERYRQLMTELLDVRDFEDFVFVVANLLIFDETRRTLAWSSDVQNRLIRMLFLPPEFDDEFSKYSELFTQNDTRGRHKSEERKDIRRQVDQWLRAKSEEAQGSPDDSTDEQKLQFRVAELQITLTSLGDEIEELQKSLTQGIARLRELNSQVDQIEIRKTPQVDKLSELERAFYATVYEQVPAEYIVLLEGLINQGVCQVCGSSGKALRKIGRQLKEKGLCLVCGSPVGYPESSDADHHNRENLAQEINSIRASVEALNSEQRACVEAEAQAKVEIEQIQKIMTGKARQRRDLDVELMELRNKLILTSGDQSGETERDRWLEQQNNRIDKLNQEIEKFYRKRDEAGKQLKELNEKVVLLLHQINERLTPLFSHFASRFLGTACELVVTQKARRKPVAYMFPRFLDKERANLDQVSESQRFFIDQAFRMALISWFAELDSQSTFCIVETPEGSLDLAYEQNVADMYLEFAKQGHAIIATSNLNSSNFLGELFAQVGVDENRVLDLLAYGHLSSVQKGHIKEFNKRLIALQLPTIDGH
jgi:DNA repair exonuclease SbcCD ATPase subunit